jgi:hypothetical protein
VRDPHCTSTICHRIAEPCFQEINGVRDNGVKTALKGLCLGPVDAAIDPVDAAVKPENRFVPSACIDKHTAIARPLF